MTGEPRFGPRVAGVCKVICVSLNYETRRFDGVPEGPAVPLELRTWKQIWGVHFEKLSAHSPRSA